MSERLFLFVQFEFPWELGPPDGRYLLRSAADGEPERVFVLGTLAARRRGALARARARAGSADGQAEPTAVATARASVVDPVPVAAEDQARAWLSGLNEEREVTGAAAALNRMLYYHRIACADPYVREVSPAQALVIRAGWAKGEQIAGGSWSFARELSGRGGRRASGRPFAARSARSAALRPDERLAAFLAGRSTPLQCEELVLRARLDLDAGRARHAALELLGAFEAGLHELRAEAREDLSLRLDELERLSDGVREQAQAARPASERGPNEEIVRHALERLEAALRARTAYAGAH